MYQKGVGSVHLRKCLRYPFTDARILDPIQEEANFSINDKGSRKNLSTLNRININYPIDKSISSHRTYLELLRQDGEKHKVQNRSTKESKKDYLSFLQCISFIYSLQAKISVNILEEKYSVNLHRSRSK